MSLSPLSRRSPLRGSKGIGEGESGCRGKRKLPWKFLKKYAISWTKFVVLGGVSVLPSWPWLQAMCASGSSRCPIAGPTRSSPFSGLVTAFALGYTQMKKSHIVVDILTETFRPEVKKVLDGISYLVSMVFFAVISWVIFVWGIQIARSGELSETLKIIYYPFIFAWLWDLLSSP